MIPPCFTADEDSSSNWMWWIGFLLSSLCRILVSSLCFRNHNPHTEASYLKIFSSKPRLVDLFYFFLCPLTSSGYLVALISTHRAAAVKKALFSGLLRKVTFGEVLSKPNCLGGFVAFWGRVSRRRVRRLKCSNTIKRSKFVLEWHKRVTDVRREWKRRVIETCRRDGVSRPLIVEKGVITKELTYRRQYLLTSSYNSTYVGYQTVKLQ